MYQAEETLRHVEKKIATAQENLDDATAAVEKQQKAISALERDLEVVNTRIASHDQAVQQRQSKGVVLEAEQLATYNKLRDVVSSKTFSEKTRFKSHKQQVSSLRDTADRYKSTLDANAKRSESITQERETLETKKNAVIHLVRHFHFSL